MIRTRWTQHTRIRSLRAARRLALSLLLATSAIARSAGPPAAQHYEYTGAIKLDLHKVWFSSYGSYMAFSLFPQGLYLRELHGPAGGGSLLNNALRVELMRDGQAVPFQAHASPVELELSGDGVTASFCFEHPDLIRVHVRGGALRLSTGRNGGYALQDGPQEWDLHGASSYEWKALHGSLHVEQHWAGTHSDDLHAEFSPDTPGGDFDGLIGDFRKVWDPPANLSPTYDGALQQVRASYAEWLRRMPLVAPAFGPAAEQAAYIDWSAVVATGGALTRPAMLMSKNWMSNLWSWDNCFNAMALAATNPQTAWDQFMIPFDDQDASGQLPDVMNDMQESWKHTKPPVQGWVLRWMGENGGSIDRARMAEIYGPLSRETEWYFRYRDRDGDGLPEYDHGDDSGWDNTTIFASAPPLETPDLAALLVVQMDELSSLARALGKAAEAQRWQARSDALLQRMLATFWDGDRFVAKRAFTHETAPHTSLILYLPLILGKRLPQPVRDKLVAGLMQDGRFVTANGFATEELNSPHYQANGYWTGPIWAPTMMMLAQGLEDSGRPDLARTMRQRFCAMAERSGFAENFEAISGRGSVLPDLEKPNTDGRDPAYTWTASVYLIFAHELSAPKPQ